MPCIFYGNSLPESAKLITIWENGNLETVETWIKTPVCESGAHVSQNFLKCFVFKKNSVLCSSRSNPEIPESWNFSSPKLPVPPRKGTELVLQTVCPSVWFGKWGFHIRQNAPIPKYDLWTGWHHWKSNNLGWEIGGEKLSPFSVATLSKVSLWLIPCRASLHLEITL